MSSVKWFEGDTKEALKLMVERNCAFLVYIRKENDEFTEALKDPFITDLLNNQLILCYEMDPTSPSFMNFKNIFANVSVPSIYLLEKNNVQQLIIKKENIINPNEMELEIKRQLLTAIYFTIKCISDTVNIDVQKHVQYMTDINYKLQILNNPTIKKSVPKVEKKIKKVHTSTKIKIKIPCEKITKVQEFQLNATLDDVKTFVLNNFHLPKGPIKFIAHRQFVEEDFCQSLDALHLTPSSTIYVHIVPPNQGLTSKVNLQSWLFNIFSFTIMKPFSFFQHYIMNFIGQQLPVQTTTPNHQDVAQTKKNSTPNKSVSNIHRLKTNESDDDENNTYNGNSTQQL